MINVRFVSQSFTCSFDDNRQPCQVSVFHKQSFEFVRLSTSWWMFAHNVQGLVRDNSIFVEVPFTTLFIVIDSARKLRPIPSELESLKNIINATYP